MCQHGYFEIQISDKAWAFVNEVCKQLHKLTGVELRVTSSYHLQVNGLVELQNRTIKNSLRNVLEDNPEMWPKIIEEILFAHRIGRHSSAKYSPFILMYNRDPVSQLCQFMWSITWTKMKERNDKTKKVMKVRNNHSISTFLMPSFDQGRKPEQQSRMMQPAILKRLRKNKNEIIIVDISLKQKLRWMILCYWKITIRWEVFTKMGQSLHCYEYLWQRKCNFKKRIETDS